MRNVCIVLAVFFTLTGCEKYKKICRDALDPRVDKFAVQFAKDCDGSPEMSKIFFGKVPNTVCGKKLAKALKGRGGLSENQIALIACPLITNAALGLGGSYVGKAVGCKKPVDITAAKTLVHTTLCTLF